MIPYINAPFISFSEATGASIDELKLVTSFLLSYPLAGVLKRLSDTKTWQKNTFTILVSIFYLVGLFDLWDGLRTLLYSASAAYAIAYFIDGSLMPWIGFLFLMGHLSVNHISRQFADDDSTVDITGAQMVMVMKLTSFCWNIHDGRLPEAQLSEAQKHAAIRKFPGLLDYAGYVFFFPSLFAGPAFDYVEYKKWIETSLFDLPPGADPKKAPATRKKRKIPRSGRPAMCRMVMGLLWIFAFLQIGPWYSKSKILAPTFLSYGILRRVFGLHMLGLTARLKYYGVWTLTEGACVLSGMGYNGFDPQDGKVHWNKLENINPWRLETAQSPHAYLNNWNKNTNHWLRNYIYLRVTPRGRKPGFRASLATFATSALWHGFYPGYYLTFILGSFVQTSAKNIRRTIRPFFLTPDGTKPTPYKRYYDILGWLGTQLTLSFAAAPFVLLSFNDSITTWTRVHFYGIISVFSSLALFAKASPVRKYLVKRLDQRNQSAAKRAKEEPARAPVLGLSEDVGEDMDEVIEEIKQEIETRRRSGSVVTMPSGQELKAAIEDKIGRKL